MKTVTISNKEAAIQLLTLARTLIQSETDQCVCFALTSARFMILKRLSIPKNLCSDEEYADTNSQLKSWVYSLLEGHSYYGHWLHRNSSVYGNLTHPEKRRASKNGRLAWIDWMISELEKIK